MEGVIRGDTTILAAARRSSPDVGEEKMRRLLSVAKAKVELPAERVYL